MCHRRDRDPRLWAAKSLSRSACQRAENAPGVEAEGPSFWVRRTEELATGRLLQLRLPQALDQARAKVPSPF